MGVLGIELSPLYGQLVVFNLEAISPVPGSSFLMGSHTAPGSPNSKVFCKGLWGLSGRSVPAESMLGLLPSVACHLCASSDLLLHAAGHTHQHSAFLYKELRTKCGAEMPGEALFSADIPVS